MRNDIVDISLGESEVMINNDTSKIKCISARVLGDPNYIKTNRYAVDTLGYRLNSYDMSLEILFDSYNCNMFGEIYSKQSKLGNSFRDRAVKVTIFPDSVAYIGAYIGIHVAYISDLKILNNGYLVNLTALSKVGYESSVSRRYFEISKCK